ncbi:MAG TPA: DUF952 domain-containing protein [Caulobacteraceae bacterium]|jgi:uncharacterized protein (DUF952 family)
MSRIYKILQRVVWKDALVKGRFEGAGVDLQDGFIHFSTASQAAETARRYFRGQSDLVVLEVESDALGEALNWEPSRGGDLFPHLYASLACDEVIAIHSAALDEEGVPRLDGLAR